MFRIRFAVLLTIALPMLLALAGCGGDGVPAASIASGDPQHAGSGSGSEKAAGDAEPVQIRAAEPSTETPARPIVEQSAPLEVVIDTSLGTIRIRLFPDKSPLTVDNFLANYVDRGFYDNTIFHFAEKDFIVAAGGFTPDYQASEPRAYIANESHNGLKNVRGTVAMSRDPAYANSANCQFFINVADNPSLDRTDRPDGSSDGYCVFGEVIEGMEVVDKISKTPVVDKENFPSTPQEPVLIHSIKRSR